MQVLIALMLNMYRAVLFSHSNSRVLLYKDSNFKTAHTSTTYYYSTDAVLQFVVIVVPSDSGI